MTETGNEKRCSKCHKVYPATLEYFHKDKTGKNGLRARCKTCCNAGTRVKAAAGYVAPGRKESLRKYNNSKKGAAVQLKYRRTPKGKALSRRAKLKYYYKLTTTEYNNMFAEQDGGCKACGIHQTELKRRLDVDHNHITGEVRGLLCGVCNRQLGAYEKGRKYNPLLTERFTRYLNAETKIS